VELDLEEDCHQKAWVKMYLNWVQIAF
jgi:hypothetical protein